MPSRLKLNHKVGSKIYAKKRVEDTRHFGYDGADSGSQQNQNMVRATLFTMGSCGGTGVSMHAQLTTNSEARKCQCAIYDSDRSLLDNGITNEITIDSCTDEWHTFTFPDAPILIANTSYYLAFQTEEIAEETFGLGLKDEMSGYSRYDDFYDYEEGSWPEPFSSDITTASVSYLIYLIYTPDVPDSVPLKISSG